ncbi:hypothetical protein [Amycolatopsis sp. CA-126428]|uniref:hypothetical protein n=1 Tax=Amycolatopsis sp. CA-126428 TaxID=2073158 RepID=UPI000CD134A0|nr:hypothetical protein [Amycolatopsis sp. CA-126428]
MKRETGDLVRALAAVTKHIPRVSTELLAGTLPADKQRELARLFDGLATLLTSHANDQEPKEPLTLADRLTSTGRELLRAAAQLEAEALDGSDVQEVSGLLKALAEVLDLYSGKLPALPVTAEPEPSEPPAP